MRLAASSSRIARSRIARFLYPGAAGALLGVARYALLALALGADYRLAIAVSFTLSYLFSFLVHRAWTFEAHDGDVMWQGWRFILVTAATTASTLDTGRLDQSTRRGTHRDLWSIRSPARTAQANVFRE